MSNFSRRGLVAVVHGRISLDGVATWLSFLGIFAGLLLLPGPADAARVIRLDEYVGRGDASAGVLEFQLAVRFDTSEEAYSLPIELRAWRFVDDPADGDDQDQAVAAEPLPVASNQAYWSDDQGAYVRRYDLGQPDRDTVEIGDGTFRLRVSVDDLDLPIGVQRLLFEARATDVTGRVSSVVCEPFYLNVQSKPEKVGVEERTQTKVQIIAEEKTLTFTFNGEEVTRSVRVTKAVPETQTYELNTFQGGEYARVYAFEVPSEVPIRAEPADENIRAELERLEQRHRVASERTQTVLYATNRELIDATSLQIDRFGNERGGRLRYGTATVRIPPTHAYGTKIKTPMFARFDDPRKHFRVTTLTPLGTRAFFDTLRTCLASQADAARATKNDVLLFVHGYNTSMEFALLRLGQIAFDIGFGGQACAFIWPSDADLFDYSEDRRDALASVGDLADLIELVAKRDQPGRVHVLAHSMGNYLVLQALQRVRQRWGALDEHERPELGHVVLAAPDVGLNDFETWGPDSALLAESLTNYHCAGDRVLWASVVRNFEQRAGLGPVVSPKLRSLVNVDCDEANTGFLGHSAFAEESPVLFDLQLLLQRDAAPEQRPTLRPRVFGAANFLLWSVRPEMTPAALGGG